MLLILDSSLIDGINTNGDIVSALDLIAHSRRLGKHIVFAKREVLKFLVTCNLLSEISRRVYQKIYNELPTLFYLKKIHFSVEVVLDDVLELIERDNSKIIRACVKYFSDFSILTETILLSENHDDLIFYKRLASAYIKWNDIGNICIRYDARSGGGHTTARDFENLQSSRQRFCLCILDSDKKTPNLDRGDTAKSVLKINDSKQPLCDIYILNVREIENLIPSSVYREVYVDDVNKLTAINFIETIDNSPYNEIRKYLDIKEGLKLYKILIEEPQKEFRKYWLSFAQSFRDKLPSECYTCLDNEVCSQGCSKKCQCYITFGFGNNIVKKVEDKYLNKDISIFISDNVRDEWEKLGSVITFWCCASSQIST